MEKTPKLAGILDPNTLAQWLGEMIQEKAGKENAGLVEVRVLPGGKVGGEPTTIKLRRSGSPIEHTLKIDSKRI